MITKPIIPTFLMLIICIFLIVFTIINKKRIIPRIIIVILLFMINIRIMLPDGKAERVVNNVDVLFVLDNSISMIAEDYSTNLTRIAGVRTNTKYIMDNLSGASFALITFNNVSNIVVPFVDDPDITYNAINSVVVKNSLYAKGTTLNVPYDDMEIILEDSEERDKRITAIFFISDGEITAEDKSLRSFSNLKKYIDSGAVLGYGTTRGGKMKADDSYYFKDSSGYMLDRTTTYPYSVALSKMNENNLKKIANDLGVDYVHMTKNSDIDNIIRKIKAKTVQDSEEAEDVYKETYYIFAIILLVVLAIEFIYIRRNLV